MRMLLVRIMSAIYKHLYKADFAKDAENNYKRLIQNEFLKGRVSQLENKLFEQNRKLAEIINNFSSVMKVTDEKLDLIREVELTEIKKMFGGEL